MLESHRGRICFYSLLVVPILLVGGAAHAQPPLYRIGTPYPPVRDPRLTTDNGIPGSGSYYFLDYPWPSLGQSLQEYGIFGRRYNQNHAPVPATSTEKATSRKRPRRLFFRR